MRICDTVQDSIVDGPGLRCTVFFQGCAQNCPECHNPQTHDPLGGRLVTPDQLIEQIRRNPILSGVTLSGGEPFLQASEAAVLARGAHALGLDVWCYSGFTWEQLTAPQAPVSWGELLAELDTLVDGPFIYELRSMDLMWRGSKNQRLIDVPQSLARGGPVFLKD
jgi:anaerobic ribonucleoside-triphosphate reductase activating protein